MANTFNMKPGGDSQGGGDGLVPGQKEARRASASTAGTPSVGRRLHRPADDAISGADLANMGQAQARARKRAKGNPVEQGGISKGPGAILGSESPDVGPDYTYKRFRLRRSEDINPYADERDARDGVDVRTKRCVALAIVVVVALIVALILPSGWFSANMRGMTLSLWMTELQHRVAGLVGLLTFQGAGYGMDFITFRYLIVAIAGAALGISGAVYQGSLKNALASPSTLGVLTGCNVGRMIYVLLFMNTTLQVSGVQISNVAGVLGAMGPLQYLWTVYGMALCALACGTIVVVLVVGVSTVAGGGRISNIVMVIVGQIVAAVIGAGVGLVQYYFTETGDARAEVLRSMQVETFTTTFRALDLLLVGVPVAICVAVIVFQRRKLNLLSFNDDEARSMGLSTGRTRWTIVIACTALTGVVVSFCGPVGMVGFMVPHLVRRVVGPDATYMVPAAGLVGAGFLVIAYFLASLFGPEALAAFGVFTSLVGSVVFLIIALKQRGSARGDWTN